MVAKSTNICYDLIRLMFITHTYLHVTITQISNEEHEGVCFGDSRHFIKIEEPQFSYISEYLQNCSVVIVGPRSFIRCYWECIAHEQCKAFSYSNENVCSLCVEYESNILQQYTFPLYVVQNSSVLHLAGNNLPFYYMTNDDGV